jgi:hypothetical protein
MALEQPTDLVRADQRKITGEELPFVTVAYGLSHTESFFRIVVFAIPDASEPIGIPALCSRRGSSGRIQDYCCATHFRYSKDHQRRIRLRLDTAICVVNVDIGVAELGRGPCQRARPVWKLDLDNLSFRVAYSLSIQDRPCRSRFVDDDAHEDRFLRGDRLKSQDIYAAVRERPADFS